MIPVVPQNLFRSADGSETNDSGDSVGRRTRWKNSNGGIGRHAQAECWRCVFFSTVSAHKKRVARFLQHLLGQMPLSVVRPRSARTGDEVLRLEETQLPFRRRPIGRTVRRAYPSRAWRRCGPGSAPLQRPSHALASGCNLVPGDTKRPRRPLRRSSRMPYHGRARGPGQHPSGWRASMAATATGGSRHG